MQKVYRTFQQGILSQYEKQLYYYDKFLLTYAVYSAFVS